MLPSSTTFHSLAHYELGFHSRQLICCLGLYAGHTDLSLLVYLSGGRTVKSRMTGVGRMRTARDNARSRAVRKRGEQKEGRE